MNAAGRSSGRPPTLRAVLAAPVTMTRAGRFVPVLLALTLPLWLGSPYFLHVVIMAGVFGILALSPNLLLRYTGPLSLGHPAFFGIRAPTSPPLTLRLAWSFLHLLPPRGRGVVTL